MSSVVRGISVSSLVLRIKVFEVSVAKGSILAFCLLQEPDDYAGILRALSPCEKITALNCQAA